MTDKNEVITDSLDFNVEGLFSNEVSLSFDKNKTKPGESLNLKVTADPASYVGLLAVDQSVLLLKGGNDITQKDVSIVGFSQIVFNTHDIYIVFF
ncbi:hypothetical protein NP493_362g01068 [Ridgeia piscesae]|uniref:Alpha-2-macroglobulin bait region domain-containing protein n=1 Tax=Ridgeia piscesae TaxID=27915 RepID=A0AAD9L3N7_RIDPI|nr:hypothetical protein NP493_362g01068 [Ridgeia piscesae]